MMSWISEPRSVSRKPTGSVPQVQPDSCRLATYSCLPAPGGPMSPIAHGNLCEDRAICLMHIVANLSLVGANRSGARCGQKVQPKYQFRNIARVEDAPVAMQSLRAQGPTRAGGGSRRHWFGNSVAPPRKMASRSDCVRSVLPHVMLMIS